MPRSERSQAIIEMLLWLQAKTKKDKGASKMQLIRHVEANVTSMGGAVRTIENYIKRCIAQGFIEIKGNKYLTTNVCKNWLERKVS